MYAALDIGGTNTRIAIFEKDKIVFLKKMPTRAKNFNLAVEEISVVLKKFKNIKGIGISAPGPSDFNLGMFKNPPNLPNWKNENIKKALYKSTGIKKIIMENDANIMALAHHNYFKNNGKITLFFTVSTGLGSGLVINNKIYRGANGLAMEVANAPVSWIKEKGKSLTEGALELFSSGSGIEFRANKKTIDVFKCAKKNDIKIIQDGIETLANMIATSIAIINPNLVVFDGSVTRNNKWFVSKSWELAKKRAIKEHFKSTEIKYGELGDDAGIYGAYQMIKDSE